MERPDDGGNQSLEVTVVPAERALQSMRKSAQERRLDEWRMIYGSVYEAQPDSQEFGENFSEWTSSYDRQPIARAEMEEWRTGTVDTVLGMRPRRILEIGAGSGLILSRVAPRCESYWATDLSRDAVDILARAVGRNPQLSGVVEVRNQPAHDFTGLPSGYFDTVILNSVVQYFPDADYLADVIEGALAALAPGGFILLGDIRNRRLRRSLYAAAELYRSDPGATAASVGRSIEQQLLKERELLLDPEFFTGLPARIEGISLIDVRLRRGIHHNELTRYRYDVLIGRNPARTLPLEDSVRLGWGAEIGEIAALEDFLAGENPAVLRLNGIPNTRVRNESGALRALEEGAPMSSVMEILRDIGVPESGLDPEECHMLGKRLGYEVRTTWSAENSDGDFDAAFALPSRIPADTHFSLSPAAVDSGPSPERSVAALDSESTAVFAASLQAYLAKMFENIPLPQTTFVITEELADDRG
ncbi:MULTISPECIES: class I SAM-dependent methyltransferase [unclassified Streptomyces]|uniref:class I SAM-dependent methyltransferase n=1 Tax=unclassified Streptomyces TaxID=2593676 RepID=UPI00324E6A72